jgi:outer membrane protein assembly factor BamB
MNKLRILSCTVALMMLADADSTSAGAGEILFINSFEGIGSAPQFVPIGNQSIVAETLMRVDVDTAPPSNPSGLDFSLDAAPAGVSINPASGLIDWTPTPAQTGDSDITVRVEDLSGLFNFTTFTVSVIDPSGSPRIEPIDDRAILVDTLFDLPVQAMDPDPGDTLDFALDEAPPGMGIDPVSGLVSWQPTVADLGTSVVRVRATDPSGQFDVERFEVTVVLENQPPWIEMIGEQKAVPDQLFELVVDATDPDDAALRYALTERPSGMSIDPDSGLIRWRPVIQQLGPHSVEIEVSDPLGFTDQTGFDVLVDLNRPPVAVNDDGFRVERGDTLTVPAAGVLVNDSDPNNDPLTTQLVTAPERGVLSLDADGGFEYTPDNPTGTIGFDLKFAYARNGGTGITHTQPLVIDLDLDGTPEIVFFALGDEVLAVNGDDGSLLWSRTFGSREIQLVSRPATADIDLDGYPEILIVANEPGFSRTHVGKKLLALEHTGRIKWFSEPIPDVAVRPDLPDQNGDMRLAAISIADIDQDGSPEILVPTSFTLGYHVWDAQGRKLDHVFTSDITNATSAGRVEVVDLDLDGDPEIVVGAAAWSHEGELLWQRTEGGLNHTFGAHFPFAVNLDDDPFPELVRRRSGAGPENVQAIALNHDGTTLWESTALVGSGAGFTLPELSAADVDGDGLVEVIVPESFTAGRVTVLNGQDGTVKWSNLARTFSEGVSMLDMDRDGFQEVLFVDGDGFLNVWDGRDGSEKLVFDAEGVQFNQNQVKPIVVDVDADGQAELVTMIGNSVAGVNLFEVWESPNDDWPPMRGIWNQNRYHVTNINADGRVPQFEQPHWLLPGLNQSNLNERLPEERLEQADQFTYRASDGQLLSNTATVDITILPPNSEPRFLSQPRTLASPDLDYVYASLAVDADIGETLTFSVAEGPAGLSIDVLGVVRWTPDAADLGIHPVVLQVTDTVGASGFQAFTIEVALARSVPDVVGLPESAAVDSIEESGLAAGPIVEVFSETVSPGDIVSQSPSSGTLAAAGSEVALHVSAGPEPLPIPSLVGLSLNEAIGRLLGAGFTTGSIDFSNHPQVPRDVVLTQSPAPAALLAEGGAIDLAVSGGPRARVELQPAGLLAGGSAQVEVSIRDVYGSELTPQPVVTLGLDLSPDLITGTAPVLNGTQIDTALDTQGQFGVVAEFDAGEGPESIVTTGVVMQPVASGASGDLYNRFADQIVEFETLVAQLIEAVDTNDVPAIESIDGQLELLRDAIDLGRLRGFTPYAPEGGSPPDLQTLSSNGFPAAIDDRPFMEASLDLLVLLQAIEQTLRAGTAPDGVLTALNQDLSATAGALAALEASEYGIVAAASPIIQIVGTTIPRLVVSDIDQIRQSLRDQGLILGKGEPQPHRASARFSLLGLMSASRIRTRIIKEVYVPYIADVSTAMGTIAVANLLEPYFNDGNVIGLVTGSSIALHVFEVPNTVVEGFGFDEVLPEGNDVLIIGPELIGSVLDVLTLDLPQAEDFKDLNDVRDEIQEIIDLGEGVVKAFSEANSAPSAVLRGCLFDNLPDCRQLLYPNGIKSVYEANGGLNLPASVVIVVRNLAGGGMNFIVANFFPTREDGSDD